MKVKERTPKKGKQSSAKGKESYGSRMDRAEALLQKLRGRMQTNETLVHQGKLAEDAIARFEAARSHLKAAEKSLSSGQPEETFKHSYEGLQCLSTR